jgi:hypothetical protein
MRNAVAWLLRASSLTAIVVLCAMTSGCLLSHRGGAGKREVGYNAILSQYSANLPSGIKRAEVENYLQRKHVQFGQSWPVDVPVPVEEKHAFADLVRVGHNHSGWPFCSGESVYIAFVFVGLRADGIRTGPISRDPEDVLKEIKLFSRPENCL